MYIFILTFGNCLEVSALHILFQFFSYFGIIGTCSIFGHYSRVLMLHAPMFLTRADYEGNPLGFDTQPQYAERCWGLFHHFETSGWPHLGTDCLHH